MGKSTTSWIGIKSKNESNNSLAFTRGVTLIFLELYSIDFGKTKISCRSL